MLELLHHTDDTVVINKPAAMAVHRSKLSHEGPYAVTELQKQLGCKVYPVHRLDRPTSGCLLFALNPGRCTELQAAMSDPAADKRYLALVRGKWKHGEHLSIDRPLKDTQKVEREAHSEAWPLASSSEPRCSLVMVRTHSGRFHQVRRHLGGVHHPVLGDSSHGDTRENRLWRDTWNLPRLALHCWKLTLPAVDLSATAPLPRDLLDVLTRMPWWSEVAPALAAVSAGEHSEAR